jgi:hypothetical protein
VAHKLHHAGYQELTLALVYDRKTARLLGGQAFVRAARTTNAAKVEASLAAGVTGWWSENSSYDYAANTCKSGEQCGHYTQLAWASNKGGRVRARHVCSAQDLQRSWLLAERLGRDDVISGGDPRQAASRGCRRSAR